jgi:hypothetical protein
MVQTMKNHSYKFKVRIMAEISIEANSMLEAKQAISESLPNSHFTTEAPEEYEMKIVQAGVEYGPYVTAIDGERLP